MSAIDPSGSGPIAQRVSQVSLCCAMAMANVYFKWKLTPLLPLEGPHECET
jgi:hypothetical protein